MDAIVTLIATLTAKPGMSDRLGEMLTGMVDCSRSEAGCITYNLHRSKSNPSVWIVYENWRSQKDLDDHMKLQPFQAFMKEAADILDNDVDFHFIDLTSPLAR